MNTTGQNQGQNAGNLTGLTMRCEEISTSHPGALGATITWADVGNPDLRLTLTNFPAADAQQRFRRGAVSTWADLGAALAGLHQPAAG